MVFLAARISYIRFFTAVQIYEFRISKIIIHHLDGIFGPNILISSQLVKRCTGIAEVMGSNPVQAWNFFQVLFSTFANCAMCPLPLRLCSIFLGVRPLNAIRSHNFSCDKRIWIYMNCSRFLCDVLFFVFILSSEFQVIISGSKKQQQKDSYQSEVPFSVIPGRTPWKQRMTRKQFTANLTWK